MRLTSIRPLLTASMLALAAACSGEDAASSSQSETAPESAPATTQSVEPETAAADMNDLEQMRAQFAVIDMNPDTSFLTDEERAVINKLNQVGELMSEIYLRQRSEMNPQWREEIAAMDGERGALLLNLFDLHFGPWDTLNHNEPFYGNTPMPAGAAFYPADITKEEFESWIGDNPEDEEAFTSGYTVIRRDGEGGLVAIPYSQHYREWLEPAARLMREAAEITTNENLKRFLNLRAESFLSDDYYESEMAWMDLDGTIEAAIGPYEVYTDGLFGYKTAFEAFITVKNPEESEALAKYKDFLRDMEANLPVEERYKNFQRGFESPIAVTYQVHGGGDNVPGVQTIAFNLPNDERVREAKGAKKVILNNVLGAKFERILEPMAQEVLVAEQAGLLMKAYMANNTLFHELSHSLGPGTITVDGEETTVNEQLQELYSPLEEGKADVMGAYNVLYMMDRGELPAAERENFLATYFTGLFRAMRFGLTAAHARGAAFQYTYYKNAGAFTVEDGKYRLDFATLEQAISDLTRDVVVVQGDGDYAAAKAFLDEYAMLDADAEAVISSLTHLPVDIQPVYEDAL
ncbi:dipeptidyl-peptidase 3 family protein [Hyphococcus sp.]|uniref:dipeptidyl-peptidase 3 family protein n=1 Tax=Hyphococcus sp. TaxID=2038636 RepID=UPI003CCC3150